MKRNILPLDTWDEELSWLVQIIKERGEIKQNIEKKELRRLIISSNHYTRKGYSGFRAYGIAEIWKNETGEGWALELINYKLRLE